MRSTRSKSLTILIVPDTGRASLKLELSHITLRIMRLGVMLIAYFVGFLGWQLQGRYGFAGPQLIELGALQNDTLRFCWFEQTAPSKQGPSRAELHRRIALSRAAQIGLGDRRAASLLLLGELEPAWIAEADRFGSDGSLLWPVSGGGYGRGFGSGEDGYHLALDIEGERGTDVYAAAPGIVGYSGRELKGYGNVVMIVHPGGRVTLYGHNQKNLVVAGERVYQGQPIAELGSTGRSMGPHLHFELKHAGRNCDPMPLMRSNADASERHWPRVTAMVWPPNEDRPKGMRCAPRRMHPRPQDSDGDVEDSAEPLAVSSP